ncbi:addiction module protein [Ornithinimicrobium cryptoxanthini]|uniref:addiction module protein n=1 Tax=Ornithinimicrobium cryptoxanthini TaxID=2934161 RepID=UPI0021180373|nr:addiction module protein [Ornithinimicrobium cryptoxanthini]
MTSTGDVFEAALTLPEGDRAELAHRLIAALGDPADDHDVVAAEWSIELSRRLADIEAGTTTGIPWEELRKQLKVVTLQVLFEPEAMNELREARRWYDDEQPGLGGDLLVEVEMNIEHALRWPE